MPVMDPDDAGVIGQVVADQRMKSEQQCLDDGQTQIEAAISDAVFDLQLARGTVDSLCSLARNWMGMTSIALGALIGSSPTTVIRRDTPGVQESVKSSVKKSARFSPEPIPPFRLDDYDEDASEESVADPDADLYHVLLDAKKRLRYEYAIEQNLGSSGATIQVCEDEEEARSLARGRVEDGVPARAVVRVVGEWESVSD